MNPKPLSSPSSKKSRNSALIPSQDIHGSLVVFDFDGTLTKSNYRSSWQAVHEYFGTWVSHGKSALELFLHGKITYKEFCEADAYAWINKTEEEYQLALSTIELREGISETIDFFKLNNCKLAIISMGLSDIVEQTANNFSFDYWIANDIVRYKGIITGEVIINVNMVNRINTGPMLIKYRPFFSIMIVFCGKL